MAIKLLFHERERIRLEGNVPDVLNYELPRPLREQIVQIWGDILPPWRPFDDDPYGMTQPPFQNQQWTDILRLLCRSFGLPRLAQYETPQDQIETFFRTADVSEAWSVVEAVFAVTSENSSIEQEWNEAVSDLSERVQQYGVGFEFDGVEVLKVDNRFIHAEVVRPALLLLSRKGFEAAEAEFLKAHEHYRHERYKEAISDALKAFESTMVCLAKLRRIELDPHLTAKPLIDAMVKEKVLPESLSSHFYGLQEALLLGLPRQRNRKAGHGDGAKVIVVERHEAAHCLHLAAADIVFLVESHLAKK